VTIAGTAFVVYGVAGLGLGGLWGLAVGLSVYHARASRVARYALGDRYPIEEGPALLGGIVESGEDEPTTPVLSVGVSAPPGSGQRSWARPFTLALRSGAKVRVEPEEGRWSLDTTFVPISRSGRTVYAALVEPGDVVYVRGSMFRENDRRAAGKGYRDAARAWVMRGDLAFCSAAVIAAHAARAAFHRAWAVGLGVLFATLHVGLLSVTDPSSSLDVAPVALAVLALLAAGSAYRIHAESTRPWLKRKVRVYASPSTPGRVRC
jgi:hypothetical protein